MKGLLMSTVMAAAANAAVIQRQSSKVKYAGVNMAGFDFGCTTDGYCKEGATNNIVETADAWGQMAHFVKDDGLNHFRLPVAWQYLVNRQINGGLHADNFKKYDSLVQGCLASGAEMCIVDIHNYARWDGGIVGQGGPQDSDLAGIWSQLATNYKDNSKIAFGIMNEPHDLDVNLWANTAQTVVNAIRKTGATSQLILVPGTLYTSAGAFPDVSKAMLQVKDTDGSTDKIIFDVHQYLDVDYSGTHTECTRNNVDGFGGLATWLRQNGRKAINSETGGGSTDSCAKYLCEQIQFLNQNSDVFIGYTGWSAGGFQSSYELNEVPVKNGNSWVDVPIVQKCIVGAWK